MAGGGGATSIPSPNSTERISVNQAEMMQPLASIRRLP